MFYFAFFNFTLLVFNIGEFLPALIANAVCISLVTLVCSSIFRKRNALAAWILSIAAYSNGLVIVFYKLVLSDFGLFHKGLLSVVTLLYLTTTIIPLRKCTQCLQKEKRTVNS